MTKIRSRDSRMIQDRRRRGGRRMGGRRRGGLGDILAGGRGRGGGLGGGFGRGAKVGGGGLIGLLILAAVVLLPQLLDGGGGTTGTGGVGGGGSEQTTGGDDDPCSSEAEQILCGATIDVQEYWIDAFPGAFGEEYGVTQTVFFSGFTSTGCGQASAATGPFYCPADGLVYFDLDFLAELQQRFGAPGDLAAQYIVAHEYGHHIQNLLGINAETQRLQQQDPARANEYSVALELQADCLAGVWAADADRRGQFEVGEIEEALEAARAVGDDRIQERTQGRVDPETWTHGSSAERERWFTRGYETADPNQCSTFDEVP